MPHPNSITQGLRRTFHLFLTFLLAVAILPAANAATVLSNGAASNPVYTEDGSEVLIGSDITFTGEQSFSGGYLDFDVTSSATSDVLNLEKVSTAITTNGVVSVVGSTVYQGDGTTANPVGSIDGTYDGSAGKKLRVRFSSAFTNAGFETGSGSDGTITIPGWTYVGTRIDIGVTTLAGVVSSDADNTYPNTCSGSSLNDNDVPASANYYAQFATDQKTEGTRSLRLYSTMTTKNGGDIVHGPAVVSDEFTAANGDVISFDWRAAAGGDDFDAYGYLINSATGAQIEVIDANGSGTNWATKSTTIPATGNYRFIFINGTHDLSCGRAAGGSLYIDNVRVVGTSVTAALAQKVARLVTYKSTSNNPATSRTVTLTAVPASGSITPLSITVDITAVDDGPVPSDISVTYTDTGANDDFTNSTGNISANDPDGGGGGGSVTYGISGGSSSSGTTSKAGTYGTLSVDEATGAYTYTPDDVAMNRVVENSQEIFTITTLSGGLTGSATLTVSITGASETSVTAPTISSISPNSGSNAGGTTVTITGSGFTTVQFVKFGTTLGTSVTIISDTSLTVVSPAKLAGSYNLTVTNDGGTNTGTNNFTYYIPTAPSAPTGVTATAGNESASVSWTASTDATSYTVTSSPGSFTCTTSSTSCTVSGLTNGTAYTFSVVASNSAGNSSPSSASTAVTPSLPLPSTPTGVSATAGDGSATVTWTASANSTSYVVTSTPGSLTCTTSSTSCSVTGLTNGSAYTFSVIGRNATGDSSASSASTAVTPSASTPTVTSVTPNSSSVNGGVLVTLTGTNFTGATSVTFGGTAGTSLTVVNDTTITVLTPARSSGIAVIVVTTGSGADSSGVTITFVAERRINSTEIQEQRNKDLAQRITVEIPKSLDKETGTSNNRAIINGISNQSNIYVPPVEIPKLPGFDKIKVSNGIIEVIPKDNFSGKMTVPVTIVENGGFVTVNIPVVINPKPPVSGASTPESRKSTAVSWEPSPNAIGYKVELKGQTLCTSQGTACSVPKLLGPNSKLTVTSLGNDGTVSTQIVPAYVPDKPIPVLDVNFKLGSAAIDEKQKKKLEEFVQLMKEEGFTKVSIAAFTDAIGGNKSNKVLSNARANAVAEYLSQFLEVELKPAGKGISPSAKSSKKGDRSARRAEISVT